MAGSTMTTPSWHASMSSWPPCTWAGASLAAQLMARYELAMRSPHVDIISHPSGRKIGQRPDLDLDWEAFFRAAAETGTLLEINGSEERLDLSAERIRAAREAGCGFVISSDAHERSEWRNLDFGVAMARRGWLEARPGRQQPAAGGVPGAHGRQAASPAGLSACWWYDSEFAWTRRRLPVPASRRHVAPRRSTNP